MAISARRPLLRGPLLQGPLSRRDLLAFGVGGMAGGAALLLTRAARAGSATPPQRVVTLGAPVSEIAVALIGPDRIVGVDTTTTYPATLAEKPRTGYLRQLAAEGVLSLRPDLILAQHDAGPPEVLDQVRAAGVRVERLDPATDMAGLIAGVRRSAQVLAADGAGEQLVAQLNQDVASLSPSSTGAEVGRTLLFLLIGHSTPMAAGRRTPVDGLIALAGQRNALTGQEGWKQLSAETVAALDPDVLLLSDQALRQSGGIVGIQAMPLFAASRAARAGRVLTVESTLLQGLGLRSPGAARDLAQAVATLSVPGPQRT